ncbi:hypothetical protein ACH4D5_36895 [Streptomyces sp. NPDC018029]|uniref:hypothetical protein n=1 Tax=Streptomyces sp. NPDC018029 TaxID=3365032 RepID=UPI0037A4D127
MSDTPNLICGAELQPYEPQPNGPASTYCMAPANHDGAHIYSARDETPSEDDGFCEASQKAPGSETLYCERNHGHPGQHRAASSMPGNTLQRLVTWT